MKTTDQIIADYEGRMKEHFAKFDRDSEALRNGMSARVDREVQSSFRLLLRVILLVASIAIGLAVVFLR